MYKRSNQAELLQFRKKYIAIAKMNESQYDNLSNKYDNLVKKYDDLAKMHNSDI